MSGAMTGPITHSNSATWRLRSVTELQLRFVAEVLALDLRPGDVIGLRGELGAGKTTFARALLQALLGDEDLEIPSPTFALAQSYEAPRFPIAHFDLYRIGGPGDLAELGFEDAFANGVALIEWPERAGAAVPADRLDVTLTETADPALRDVALAGHGSWAARAARLGTIARFLEQAGWGAARVHFLQGDASTRRYARLARDGGRAILMDAPRQGDGPIVRDGKSYSRIAHLAEDVRPFIAIDRALRTAGFSAPDIYAQNVPAGLLLIEDLGDRVFGAEMRSSTPQATLWRAAVDALIEMRRMPPGHDLPLGDGTTHTLPRFDRAALEIEIDMLLEWYWPEVKGAPAPEAMRAEFHALWSPVLDRLMALEPGWFLRDVHSPNLIWLPERHGVRRIGLIDFQDALAEHFAFDLASLLQDARVDVPATLEAELLDYYCATVAAREPGFERADFAAVYAAFGAQRNTRLIGLWVRLLRRDGKPGYLQHMARTWGYLERNLKHPALAGLRGWYDANLGADVRARKIVA